MVQIRQTQATSTDTSTTSDKAQIHQLQEATVNQILPLPQVIARIHQLQATAQIHLPLQMISTERQLQVTVQILPLPQVIAQIHPTTTSDSTDTSASSDSTDTSSITSDSSGFIYHYK